MPKEVVSKHTIATFTTIADRIDSIGAKVRVIAQQMSEAKITEIEVSHAPALKRGLREVSAFAEAAANAYFGTIGLGFEVDRRVTYTKDHVSDVSDFCENLPNYNDLCCIVMYFIYQNRKYKDPGQTT